MKKISYLVLAAVVAIASTSCKKYLSDVQSNPNDPEKASPKVLLSAIEMATFANYTGNNARRSSVFVQQIAGTNFQMYDVHNYIIVESDVDNDWQTIYSGAVVNAQLLIDDFGADNPHYAGIAKILKAMNIGLAADMWGDVPSKEVAQGIKNLNPKYDSQQAVYGDIQTMLSEAITDLQKPITANKFLPSNEDYIFSGDASHWIQTAYVLKARYANRLYKNSPASSATDALSYLNAAYTEGFASSADNAMAVFGQGGNESNQWANFNSTRAEYIKMGAFLVDTLNSLNDPRLAYYADPVSGTTYVGADLANPDASSSSDIGPYLDQVDAPNPLVSFEEAKFIEAECKLRSGDAAGAATAYNDAVKESILEVTGAPDVAYEALNASATAATISLAKIMLQKYIALYSQIEVWTDWRRTGFPALSPNPSAALGGIPRRLPTPRDERTYNSNVEATSNILTPLWFEQ